MCHHGSSVQPSSNRMAMFSPGKHTRMQVTYYDDIGEAYEWAVKLPVAAVSLDFLGVPGSALGNETAALVEKYGFPNDKRLGAGVVDGRSVFADGDTPTNLVAALLKKVRDVVACLTFLGCHWINRSKSW